MCYIFFIIVIYIYAVIVAFDICSAFNCFERILFCPTRTFLINYNSWSLVWFFVLPFPRKVNSFPSRLGELSIVKFSRFFLLLLSAAARSHRTCYYYYTRLRLNVCLPRRYFQHLHLDLTLKKIQQRKKLKWAAAAVSERKRGRGKRNLNKRKLLEFLATHQKVFFMCLPARDSL